MSEIEVRAVRYDDPVAQRLVGAALADLSARYGGPGDETPVDAAEFAAPRGAFLVAFFGSEPVGCAGWRSRGDAGEVAELKRMYTSPVARGRGVARTLLAAVEDAARREGRRRLILECGDRQPEAVGLYIAYGFKRIENFGHYRHHAGVLSFGLDL